MYKKILRMIPIYLLPDYHSIDGSVADYMGSIKWIQI